MRAGAGNTYNAATVCFCLSHPKTREIHAPDFAERIATNYYRNWWYSRCAITLLQKYHRINALCNAAAQCGLPVGNLTSQFFANVYLDALDQFIKHTLKVRYFVRYLDDFVLLGSSQAQLQSWQAEIEQFLQQCAPACCAALCFQVAYMA